MRRRHRILIIVGVLVVTLFLAGVASFHWVKTNSVSLTPTSVFGDENTAWIEYDIGPGTLAIGNGVPEWKPSPHGGVVALEVEDFDEAVSRLNDAGIEFAHGPDETPVCSMAVISDPDGNSVIIHKRKG